jgi:ribosomal protein L37AE/L43A
MTLDSQHNTKIKEFNSSFKDLNKKKNKLESMRKEYNKLAQKRAIEMSEDEIEMRLSLKERIADMERSIESIESFDSINDYLLDSAQILFHYYDDSSLQNSSTKPVSTTANKSKKKGVTNNVSILDLFTRSAKKEEKKKEETCVGQQPPQTNPDENDGGQSPKFTKNRIINEYKRIIERDYVDDMDEYNQDMDYCSECNTERIFYQSEGIMVCPDCGTIEKMLVDSDKPSYKEPPREISYFAYKRINHFNESSFIYAKYMLLTMIQVINL